MLSKDAINQYKKLFATHYGVVLSDAEAARRANNLINFYRAVCKVEPLNPTEMTVRHDNGEVKRRNQSMRNGKRK